MGKPENGPPSGQSVEQLLSSIRQAIEADGSAVPAAAEKAPPKRQRKGDGRTAKDRASTAR
jgi:hypothetical protein